MKGKETPVDGKVEIATPILTITVKIKLKQRPIARYLLYKSSTCLLR